MLSCRRLPFSLEIRRVPRRINILMLVLIIVGVVLTIGETQRNRMLRARHDDLARDFGSFSIADPAKIYVLALDSDSPLHFRWRVYFPPKFNADWRAGENGVSRTRSSSFRDFILEARIRKDVDGHVRVFLKRDMGKTVLNLGNDQVASFLSGKWAQLEIWQVGKEGLVELDVSDVVTLVEVRMTDKLAAEAESVLTDPWNKRHVPTLFRWQVATPEAYSNAETSTNE